MGRWVEHPHAIAAVVMFALAISLLRDVIAALT
jgi:hypothetical protein